MKKMRRLWISSLMALLLLSQLSGCAIVPHPGGEPFGETTYSQKEAEEIYQKAVDSLNMEKIESGDYSIHYSDDSSEIALCKSPYYTVASAEMKSGEKYFWYENTLYLEDGDKLSYKTVSWDELVPDTLRPSAMAFSLELLARNDGTLTFKHIPMAGDSPYLLTAEYPQAAVEWGGQKVSPSVGICMSEDKKITYFGASWTTPATISGGELQDEGKSFSMSQYFGDDETDFLQVERQIWDFGQRHGLTDEVLPALSTQEEDREWCRGVIEGMDFERLKEQSTPSSGIVFPTPFEKVS